MHAISGPNCRDAWRSAVECLLGVRATYTNNLIVKIEDASIIDPQWLEDHNPRYIRPDADRIGDVANTLFPNKTWVRAELRGKTRDDFYQRYKEVYAAGKRIGPNARRNRQAWGTYFLRLISFGDSEINQLERAIQVLTKWGRHHRGAITFHLSSPETDTIRLRGGPCWHFGELSYSPPEFLNLTVAYRSHDYFNKALGNFIGLSELLSFICQHSGMVPGTLTCHSVYAWHGSSKEQLRTLAKL